MGRFRLLGFYVAGLVLLVGLAVCGVSTRRTVTEAGLAAVPESGTEAPAAQDAGPTPVKVAITNFAFEPKELIITAGTTVTWVNADDVPHTATSTASPPAFNSKLLDADDTFSFEFRAPGTYEYFCKLHPYMTGKVVVK